MELHEWVPAVGDEVWGNFWNDVMSMVDSLGVLVRITHQV